MPAIRKGIRTALVSVLSDPATGFNARHAAIAAAYGVDPIVIDWTAGSANFVQMFLPTEVVLLSGDGISQIADYPALVMYTSQAASDVAKFSKFSGNVLAHLDFYIGQREGIEVDNTEDLLDSIEDAVIECLSVASINWTALSGYPAGSSLMYDGRIQDTRSPVRLTGDGWDQVIPIALQFSVDL